MHLRAIALLLAIALTGFSVAAQGTSYLLPDPISTGELIQWFDEFAATRDQRAAVLILHDAYLAQMKSLREGRIQTLLDLEKKSQAINVIGYLAEENDLRRFVRQLESIQSEIKRLDGTFLDGLDGSLSGADDADIERLRDHREHARLNGDFLSRWWLPDFYLTDLQPIAAAAKLTEEETEIVDHHLREFERSLTVEWQRLVEIAHDHILVYRDALDEAGMRHDPDHIQGGAIQEEQLRIWSTMREEPGDQARRVLRLREAFVREAAAALPIDAGHRYRVAYLRSGASRVSRHDREVYRLDKELEDYLKRTDVSEDDRTRLIEIRDRYHEQWAPLADEMQEATIECYGGMTFVWSEELRVRQVKFQEWSAAWAERCRLLAERTRAAITGAIGPERTAEMTAAYERWVEELRAKNTGNESDQILLRSPAYRYSQTQVEFLPLQVARADFDLYAARLQLSEDQLESARARFDQYLTDLRALAERELEGLYRQVGWNPDPETGVAIPPPFEEFERAVANRERMIEEMNALHSTLLRDLTSLTDDPVTQDAIAVVELHRDARTLAECESPFIDQWSGYTEVRANTIDAIFAADVPHESRDKALTIAVLHGDDLRAQWMRHFEAQRQQQFENERGTRDMAPLRERNAPVEEYLASEPYARMAAAADAVIETRNAVIEANRAILAEIQTVLPAREGVALRLAYLREAYPSLFSDQTFDPTLIPRAMSLKGITDAQKIELAVIEWDHAQPFTDLSMEMCEILRHAPTQGMAGSSDWIEVGNDRKDRQDQVECLRFYRTELNHRARLKVQDALTEEQWEMLTTETVDSEG